MGPWSNTFTLSIHNQWNRLGNVCNFEVIVPADGLGVYTEWLIMNKKQHPF